MTALTLKLKLAVEQVRERQICGAVHPLSENIICLKNKWHPGNEHAFGDEPGMVVWRDDETHWRFRPTTIGTFQRWEGR